TFHQVQADPQADYHHHRREQEGNAPAPVEEGLGGAGGAVRGQQRGDDQEQADGNDGTQRRTQLREGAEQRALALRGVFGGDQRGSRPLATDGKALGQSHQHQQQRCYPADAVVGRQQTDQEGGDAHGQQGVDQGLLAPDLVTQMAEEDRTQGSGNHGCTEDGEGRQQGGGLVARGKEQVR